MKKICICLIAVLLLCGCGNDENNSETETTTVSTEIENTTNNTEVETATNVADEYDFIVPTFSQIDLDSITDFKCTVRYNNSEEDIVIEDDSAKELYRILSEVEKTEEGINVTASDEYVSLQFESSETGEHICESCTINNNDEMAYSLNPYVSYQATYKLKEGTYSKLILEIEELS